MKLFNTFFIGGFECADHINRSGNRINLLIETRHHQKVDADYALLKAQGITTVREGICWSFVETQPYVYNFAEVENRIKAAQKHGIQQLWSLCHFGYPDGLIPTHPQFTGRFTSLCYAFVRFYKEVTKAQLFINPINEISFLSWHSGDMRGTVPFAVNSGFDIKYHLCKAAIEGSKAIKEADPEAILFASEPLIKIHSSSQEDESFVKQLNQDQFQTLDIITGAMCPELGGNPNLLNFVGLNYYYNNQWWHKGPNLSWIDNEQTPLPELLSVVATRYNKPLVLTETGHFGIDKAEWLIHITKQIVDALNQGIDIRGICIYPVIDRPDWDDLHSYSQCGLWDLDEDFNRIPHNASLFTLSQCMQWLNSTILTNNQTAKLKIENHVTQL